MDALNFPEIRRLLLATPEITRGLTKQEKNTFESAKRNLIAEFQTHPVTQEILGGVDATNISGTLGGKGNLFTFIGFPAGSTPIEIIVTILTESLTIGSPIEQDTTNGFNYKFGVSVPLDEIYEATPLPFETGNSWVAGIENGISGFSNFLYQTRQGSRSGKGIETKGLINTGDFQPVPYLPTMLKTFVENLGGRTFSFDY